MGIFSPGTDTTTSTFTPVQAGQIQELLQGASGQFQKGFFDPSVFNQSGVAGFTPQQLQALQQQEAQAGSLSRFTPQAEAGIQQLLSGQINPIFEQQAQQQANFLQRNFERNVLPTIGDQFQGSGQFGSSRQGIAEGIAASDLNQDIQRQTSNIFATGAQQAQQGQQFALSNLGSLLGQAQAPSQQLFNVGSQFQQQNQAQLTDQLQRNLALQQLPLAELQAFQGLISGNYGGTTTGTTPRQGLGSQLLLAGAKAAGQAAASSGGG